MAKIDSYSFGKIVIDSKRYTHDVLILPDGTVKAREPNKGKHKITAKEITNLHNMQADTIVIGTGESGTAKLTGNATGFVETNKLNPAVLKTPLAVEKYNQKVDEGKSVAALIHITC